MPMPGLELLVHLPYLVYAVAFLFKDALWLRGVAILGGLIAVAFGLVGPEQPNWTVVAWNIVFIVIHGGHLAMTFGEPVEDDFSEAEKKLLASVFSGLAPVDFKKLMQACSWQTYHHEHAIVQEGAPVDSLSFIHEGSASVFKGDRAVATLRSGDFIGEMSFNRRLPASATVTASPASRIVSWPVRELRELLDENPRLRTVVQRAIGMDLEKKMDGSA